MTVFFLLEHGQVFFYYVYAMAVNKYSSTRLYVGHTRRLGSISITLYKTNLEIKMFFTSPFLK